VEDHVRVIPSAWGKEKEELFRKAAVFVLPSHTENLPLVILEAAAAGLAIVTTPVGAIPEILQDGDTAVFVPPGDAGKLRDALRNVLANPGFRQRLGENARVIFRQKFSRERIMGSLDAVYQRALQ
jgi:glycosyltransferase involved in cell wall biosynthesis